MVRSAPAILAGKKLRVIGSTQQPRSFTYVPDLAAAMIRAAQPPELWNKVWHAPTGPAITQHWLSAAFADAAGVRTPEVRAIPGWALRAAGLFSTDIRELAEMLYQFEKPFIMDSAASESALGLRPTPFRWPQRPRLSGGVPGREAVGKP